MCGSFVQILPPEGWQPPPRTDSTTATDSNSPPLVVAPQPWSSTVPDTKRGAATGRPSPAEKRPHPTRPTPKTAAAEAALPIQPAAKPAMPRPVEPPVASSTQARQTAEIGAAAIVTEGHAIPRLSAPARTVGPPLVPFWAKLVLLAGIPLLGLWIVALGWVISRWAGKPAPPPPTADVPATPSPAEETAVKKLSAAPVIDPRWLPDATVLLVSLHPPQAIAQMIQSQPSGELADLWQATFGPALASLGLQADATERVTYAATDLSNLGKHRVVALELADPRTLRGLVQASAPADFSLFGAQCRRLSKTDGQPLIVPLDAKTVLTGDEPLLRELASRSQPHFVSHTIEQLLPILAVSTESIAVVDLSAARAAHWKLPVTLLDIWPADKGAWRTLWTLPEGIALKLQLPSGTRGDLAWVCDSDSTAERVRSALEQLLPAARQAVRQQIAAVSDELRAGNVKAGTAESFQAVLEESARSLENAGCEVLQRVVWLRAESAVGTAAFASAALGAREGFRAAWFTAARAADQVNYDQLLAGLGGYTKAEGQYPEGALGGALLPPETRLSWIATLLPYFGHSDWHRKLEPGYPWNSPQNRPVTKQTLPEVINPALEQTVTEAGFPVTHYAGVAGVGDDAGQLPPDSPRAGVFSYGRGTRLKDITDGSSNTIAILGVSGQPGPWAAGGNATVRALTKQPYVNGPDGFGSGLPDGMLAGMADGSVRLISKDCDPSVLEQLVTIHGGEASVAAVQPKTPTKPKPESKSQREQAENKKGSEGVDSPKTAVAPSGTATASKNPGPAVSKIDLAARLATPLSGVELSEMPLVQAVRTLADLGGVPASLDPDGMADLGVAASDPVSVKLEGTTVGKALAAVAATRGVVCVTASDCVVMTSPADLRETLRDWEHSLVDLTGGQAAADRDLAALVERMIAPESWRSSGGRGTLRLEGGVLRDTQTASVQARVLLFLEKLRMARGKPLQTQVDPELVKSGTRLTRASRLLGQPLTAAFHEPALLSEIVGFVEDATSANLLVDWPALAAAGISGQSQASWAVDKQPLGAALDEWLRPLGLAYRAIDGETIQITSQKAATARLDVEFYRVPKLPGTEKDGPSLVERIKAEVMPGSWADAGGPGAIYFDAASKCLIVLQSQAVHRAIQQLLSQKAA